MMNTVLFQALYYTEHTAVTKTPGPSLRRLLVGTIDSRQAEQETFRPVTVARWRTEAYQGDRKWAGSSLSVHFLLL